MTIYLYVKTHRTTGLKYLGKTEQEPFKYQGSGDYWTNHINVHGYDVDTIILRECQSAEELKEWGLYYSNLWNVVESDEWANLKEESGDGNSSADAKRLWESPEYRAKQYNAMSARNREAWSDPAYRLKMSEQTKKQWEDPAFIEIHRMMWENPEFRAERVERCKQLWENPEYREKILVALNDPAYKERQSEVHKKLWENQEYQMKMTQAGNLFTSDGMKKTWANSPERKIAQSNLLKSMWEDENFRKIATEAGHAKLRELRQDKAWWAAVCEKNTGAKHPKHDPAIFHFINDDGREEICTKSEIRRKHNLSSGQLAKLTTGRSTRCKGWRIKKES